MRVLLLSLVFAFSISTLAATEPKRLVIIGDSLTEGYGVSHSQAYPALLQKEIDMLGKKWKVVNAGISGSTSASAHSQVQWHLKQKPDLILIALGANDGLRRRIGAGTEFVHDGRSGVINALGVVTGQLFSQLVIQRKSLGRLVRLIGFPALYCNKNTQR